MLRETTLPLEGQDTKSAFAALCIDLAPFCCVLHWRRLQRLFLPFGAVLVPPCSFLHSLFLMHTLVVCTRKRTNSGFSTNSGSLHCVLHIGGPLCCVVQRCGVALLRPALMWGRFAVSCNGLASFFTVMWYLCNFAHFLQRFGTHSLALENELSSFSRT